MSSQLVGNKFVFSYVSGNVHKDTKWSDDHGAVNCILP